MTTSNLESVSRLLAESKLRLAELDVALDSLTCAEAGDDAVLTTPQTARLLLRVEKLRDRVGRLVHSTLPHLELLPGARPHEYDGGANAEGR